MFILINHVLLYFYFQLSYNVCRGENMELIKNIIIYGILGAIRSEERRVGKECRL